MVAALNRAEDGGTKPPHSSKDQVAKARWSKRLADGCAVAIANEFRRIKSLQSQTIRPDADGKKSEPLTRLSGSSNKSKRIDVTVVDPLAGLHIGVSCKGFNFLDVGGENYDKNMSGRFYELADEMRLVHEHLPRAFLAAVLFLPLPASRDKGKRSSFAHMVVELRERTNPADPSLPRVPGKCDMGWVALYAEGDEPEGFPRGVVRFFNAARDCPRSGRPKVLETESLSEMAAAIVEAARRQIKPNYVAAEEDRPSTNASASSGVSATGATAGLGDGTPLTLDMLTTGAALRKVAEPTEDDYGADEDEDIVDDADDDDEVEAENGK